MMVIIAALSDVIYFIKKFFDDILANFKGE